MEVHTHSHAHSHGKKWISRLWEFLMLFLAVTLGFFVENQREHLVEHNRAKDFARSLVQDLRQDTAAVSRQQAHVKIYNAVVDTLVNMNDRGALRGPEASRFCFFTRFAYWTPPINWNRASFEQVKNSGSLRYFRNYKIQEKLTRYDVIINGIEAEYNIHGQRGLRILDLANRIMPPAYYQELSRIFLWQLDTISKEKIDRLISREVPPMDQYREDIKELINMCIVQQRNLRRSADEPWEDAKKLATEIMQLLEKEYNLE